jgi:hypothetical protein
MSQAEMLENVTQVLRAMAKIDPGDQKMMECSANAAFPLLLTPNGARQLTRMISVFERLQSLPQSDLHHALFRHDVLRMIGFADNEHLEYVRQFNS